LGGWGEGVRKLKMGKFGTYLEAVGEEFSIYFKGKFFIGQ
jgi:hypothetical protein